MDIIEMTGADDSPLWKYYRLERFHRPRNRFENALFIQGGASNGLGVSKALAAAYSEAARERHRGTDSINRDPAVQLILHQLAHLAAIPTHSENGRWWDWDRATKDCIERCQSWHVLVTLNRQDEVRLFVCDYHAHVFA